MFSKQWISHISESTAGFLLLLWQCDLRGSGLLICFRSVLCSHSHNHVRYITVYLFPQPWINLLFPLDYLNPNFNPLNSKVIVFEFEPSSLCGIEMMWRPCLQSWLKKKLKNQQWGKRCWRLSSDGVMWDYLKISSVFKKSWDTSKSLRPSLTTINKNIKHLSKTIKLTTYFPQVPRKK